MPCLALCSSKWAFQDRHQRAGDLPPIRAILAAFFPPGVSNLIYRFPLLEDSRFVTYVTYGGANISNCLDEQRIIIQPSRPPTFVEELSGGDASDELHSTWRAYSWKSLPERQSMWLNVSSGSGEFMVLRANIFGSGLHRREEQSSPGMLINSDWGT